MQTESIEKTTQDFMQLDPEGTLTITLRTVDGARLLNLQKAVLLAIEEVGCCERSGSEEYRNAIFELTWLFRAIMFNESQTNIALGGKPFGSDQKSDKKTHRDFMTYELENRNLMIVLQNVDGSRLLGLQKALLLGIEDLGYCERSDGQDYRDAIFYLTWLLRAIMLNESQTNIGLGGKAYKE